MTIPYLSILMALPLLGIVFISLIDNTSENAHKKAKQLGLLVTLVVFLLSLFVLYNYEYRIAYYQFEEMHTWFPGMNISYHVGLDGLSIYFVMLTTLLMPMCVMASWNAIVENAKSFMICLLALETLIIGMFSAIDLILFYICFEGVLIPMFFMIGIWGGKNRFYASFKLFLYTLLGSVFMLLAMTKLYIETGDADLPYLLNHALPEPLSLWLFLGFFIAFAVKIPIFPLHTWLPDAHTEAPTAGSVLLAGILLKMGGYGILRICLPLFPHAAVTCAPYIIVLSLIAIVYTSLIALAQTDMKKLIAYSSVAHMGFVTLGIFHFNAQSLSGAVIQMLSHGLISSALFLCIGVLYERFHTREIADYGGLSRKMPWFCGLFMLFTMASVGLPGTIGFIGEMLVIVGTFKVSPLNATIAATSLFLSAAYALWLYKRICQGPENENNAILKTSTNLDLNKMEFLNLGVLAALVVYFGFYAQPLLAIINPSIIKIQAIHRMSHYPHMKKRQAKIDCNADEGCPNRNVPL